MGSEVFWGYVLLYVMLFLVALILFRALRNRSFSKYLLFCVYLVSVLIGEAFFLVASHVTHVRSVRWSGVLWILWMFFTCGMLLEIPRSVLPRQQRADNLTRFTWVAFYGVMFCYAIISTAMAIPVGCVIVAEILRYVLSPHEKLEKFFRFLRVAIAAVILYGSVGYMRLPPTGTANKGLFVAGLTLTRDFRLAQVVLMLAIVAVLFFYRIPLGKNLKGMLLGFGVYAGAQIVLYSLRLRVGHPLFGGWLNLTSLSYALCALIWLVSFWSYHPNPPSAVLARIALESEAEPRGMYEGIAAHALRVMARGGLAALRRVRASFWPAKSEPAALDLLSGKAAQ